MRRTLPLMLSFLLAAAGCAPSASPPDPAALGRTIDALVAAHPDATVAVAVRDAATGTTFDREADRLFHAASTMKIPVMIEVYRRVGLGEMALDDSLEVRNAFRSIVDGSPFAIEDDSDDAIYDRLGSRMAVADLVRHMIVVSSNLATNLLIDHLGAASVQATSEALGTTRMQTLRGVEDLKAFELGLSNRTTAADLAVLLEALRDGRAVSPALDSAMVAVLTAQEFNEMIPSGLPEGTRVAHKTGRITEIDHDAAIVYPAGGGPYVLVILIEGLADPDESEALGAAITSAVHAALRP